MKKGKEVKISYWAAHAITIVSVTLVLIILGFISLIILGARHETARIRESLEVSIIMADSVSNPTAAARMNQLRSLPYCNNLRLISKEQAMADWKVQTGEDLEELFGVNPLSPEITFTLPEQYSRHDSIAKIEKFLSALPDVEEVATPQGEVVDAMNTNIAKLGSILGAIAIVLLIISFVLINNTVHLTIYARRFTIHTMQLVGATNSFIRRPIVGRNFVAGLLAGLIASALVWIAIGVAPRAGYPEITQVITLPLITCICAGLVILGGLLCSLAATIATQHYLRKDYDQLFK